MALLFARLAGALAFFLLLFPLVTAHGGGNPEKSCKKGEFWWKDKECCLPDGGYPTPPKPPKDHECPPKDYYWNKGKGCCVPSHPPPESHPPPQCPKGWQWTPKVYSCLPIPPPSTPIPPPSPSGFPGHDGGHGGWWKGGWHGKGGHYKRSELKSRLLCPSGLDACPIPGLTAGEFECLDVSAELESCGGCVSLGQGQDCSTIPGAWNVGCEQGSCVVYSCASGFVRSHDGKSCVAL